MLKLSLILKFLARTPIFNMIFGFLVNYTQWFEIGSHTVNHFRNYEALNPNKNSFVIIVKQVLMWLGNLI